MILLTWIISLCCHCFIRVWSEYIGANTSDQPKHPRYQEAVECLDLNDWTLPSCSPGSTDPLMKYGLHFPHWIDYLTIKVYAHNSFSCCLVTSLGTSVQQLCHYFYFSFWRGDHSPFCWTLMSQRVVVLYGGVVPYIFGFLGRAISDVTWWGCCMECSKLKGVPNMLQSGLHFLCISGNKWFWSFSGSIFILCFLPKICRSLYYIILSRYFNSYSCFCISQ